MRRFRQAERSALEDVVRRPTSLPVLASIPAARCQQSGSVRDGGPRACSAVLAPVVVVKERWIEPAAVQINRIRPIAIDTLARDEIVMEVAQRGARRAGGRRPAVALHVGVNQMKEAVGMRQARCPDAARVGIGIADAPDAAAPRRRPSRGRPRGVVDGEPKPQATSSTSTGELELAAPAPPTCRAASSHHRERDRRRAPGRAAASPPAR